MYLFKLHDKWLQSQERYAQNFGRHNMPILQMQDNKGGQRFPTSQESGKSVSYCGKSRHRIDVEFFVE